MAKTGIQLIATLALLGNVGLLVLLVLFLAQVFFKNTLLKKLVKTLAPHNYYFVFLLSLIATLSSLFLSEIVKFQPCILCWYQRITMYPQTLLLYIAIIRREKVLTPYLIALNCIGVLVSLYHYSLHVLPRAIVLLSPCSSTYAGVPCDKGYNFYYGFMTFPYMAFTVFALNIILLSMTYAYTNKRKG